MNKFEIGDKIKIARLDIHNHLYVTGMNENLGNSGVIKSFDLTAKEALIRMEDSCHFFWVPLEWLELVEKASNSWTGKVVCTYVNDGSLRFFTEGKAYPVYKGTLYDDDGVYGQYFTSANDINRNCKGMYKFIEFKGFANTGKDKNE